MSRSDARSRFEQFSGHVSLFTGDSARRFRLPQDGKMYVGLGDGGEIAVSETALSSPKVILRCNDGAIFAVAGRAAFEATLNGNPIDPNRRIRSGDSLLFEGAQLVFTCSHDGSIRRSPADVEEFERRLREEVERSLRYSRPLAVVVIATGITPLDADVLEAVNTTLRAVDVLGDLGDGSLGLLLPETSGESRIPVERALSSLMGRAPDSRAAIGLCPSDGTDADALLVGVKFAADQAPPGSVVSLIEGARTFSAGEHDILAADPRTIRMLDLVRSLARSKMPVLVSGDTGVGKELIASALHAWSPRGGGPFISVNCAAMTESLLEAELFGHEKGAFTDAHSDRAGLFEAADGGTLLLDEIGDASQRVQGELLRVLETGRIRRVGSTKELAVDVRVVAATNRDLLADTEAGGFRKDLFYRLGAAKIEVPPLAERPLDIQPLARRFLKEACVRLGNKELELESSALQRLALHSWPGNVREVRNMMEFVAATAKASSVSSKDLPENVAADVAPWLAHRPNPPGDGGRASGQDSSNDPLPYGYGTLADELGAIEGLRMEQALRSCQGVRNRAAALIGMPLRTFVSKMQKYELDLIPSTRKRGR